MQINQKCSKADRLKAGGFNLVMDNKTHESTHMPIHLECLSHTPLQGYFDPILEVAIEVEFMQTTARARVLAYNPDLIVVFAPDHYNGFFMI